MISFVTINATGSGWEIVQKSMRTPEVHVILNPKTSDITVSRFVFPQVLRREIAHSTDFKTIELTARVFAALNNLRYIRLGESFIVIGTFPNDNFTPLKITPADQCIVIGMTFRKPDQAIEEAEKQSKIYNIPFFQNHL